MSVFFASPIVRVGFGSSWHSPATGDAVTLFFPRTCAPLFEGEPRIFADPNIAIIRAPHSGDVAREPAPNATASYDWFSVATSAFGDAPSEPDSTPDWSGGDGRPSSGWSFGLTGSQTYLWQRAIVEYLRSSSRADCFLVEEAVLLLVHDVAAEVASSGWSTRATSAHETVTERAREQLAVSFASREPAQALAGPLKLPARSLGRIFRRHTGVSLQSYRHNLRLRHALGVLRRADLELPAIAAGLGFCSHSHFTMAFRRAYGVTPSKFRNWIETGVWRSVLNTLQAGPGNRREPVAGGMQMPD